MAESVFDSNTAQSSGGGWAHAASTSVVLQDTVFTNNVASVGELAAPIRPH